MIYCLSSCFRPGSVPGISSIEPEPQDLSTAAKLRDHAHAQTHTQITDMSLLFLLSLSWWMLGSSSRMPDAPTRAHALTFSVMSLGRSDTNRQELGVSRSPMLPRERLLPRSTMVLCCSYFSLPAVVKLGCLYLTLFG